MEYKKEHSMPIAGYNDNNELIVKFNSVSNAEKYYKEILEILNDDSKNINTIIYKVINLNRKYKGLKWYYFINLLK